MPTVTTRERIDEVLDGLPESELEPLLEIIISLTVTGGLSDLTLRDVGVLGLAVCLSGIPGQRLVLRR